MQLFSNDLKMKIKKQNPPLYPIILLCLLFIFSQSLMAKNVYVSDQLSINMRTDKGVEFKIIKVLESGTKLIVLEDDKSGYTKVKTAQGLVGWVLSRFLQDDDVARSKNKRLTKSYQQLLQQQTALKEQYERLKNEHSQLLQTEEKLTVENEKINKDIERLRKIAARPMQLENDNEKLRNEILNQENNSRLLKQQVQTYRESSERDWFISGALVLLGGIFLGLFLPKMKSNRQRKGNWNRLN